MFADFFPFALACSLIVTIPFSIATTVPYPSRFANRILIPETWTDQGSNLCKLNKGSILKLTGDYGLPV